MTADVFSWMNVSVQPFPGLDSVRLFLKWKPLLSCPGSMHGLIVLSNCKPLPQVRDPEHGQRFSLKIAAYSREAMPAALNLVFLLSRTSGHLVKENRTNNELENTKVCVKFHTHESRPRSR